MQEESKYVKYPKTFHLPWSPNLQNDDRVIQDLSVLENCDDIIITEKMDGENTTFYNDTLHARSLDSRMHPSRSRVKQIWSSIAHNIPEDFRICGENMYAKHSIYYDNLESYFLVFNIWQGDICLSWDETVEWCDLLGLQSVPVSYRGRWDPSVFERIQRDDNSETCEGYCVRVARQFDAASFETCTAKYVRNSHVRTSQHWMQEEIIPNALAKKTYL